MTVVLRLLIFFPIQKVHEPAEILDSVSQPLMGFSQVRQVDAHWPFVKLPRVERAGLLNQFPGLVRRGDKRSLSHLLSPYRLESRPRECAAWLLTLVAEFLGRSPLQSWPVVLLAALSLGESALGKGNADPLPSPSGL